MGRQQSHGLAFVQGQGDASRIPQQEDKLLEQGLITFDHFEGGGESEQCFDRPHEQHADHHDREDGYTIPRHVHQEHVHRDLLQGT